MLSQDEFQNLCVRDSSNNNTPSDDHNDSDKEEYHASRCNEEDVNEKGVEYDGSSSDEGEASSVDGDTDFRSSHGQNVSGLSMLTNTSCADSINEASECDSFIVESSAASLNSGDYSLRTASLRS